MYGLRTAPATWQHYFAEVLVVLGLRRSTAEPNIYMTDSAYVMVYVDDLLILGAAESIDYLVKSISSKVLLKKTGSMPASGHGELRFLGRLLRRETDTIYLSTSGDYIGDLLKEFGLQNCRPASTPLPQTTSKLENADESLTPELHRT